MQRTVEVKDSSRKLSAKLRPLCKADGFTLVELSIVLVILGLLVGGVLAGQALIHSAELRSIIQEKQKFTTSSFAFREKYMAYPGDMLNASDLLAGGSQWQR